MKNDKIKKFIKMYLLNTTVCPYCYKKIKLKEDDNGTIILLVVIAIDNIVHQEVE